MSGAVASESMEQEAEVFGHRLPIEPLLSYIDSQGGLSAVVRRGLGIAVPDEDEEETEAERFLAREVARLRKRLKIGKERGWLDLFWVDAMCVETLKVHPLMVYGDLFLTAPEDELLQKRLAKGVEVEAVAA